jgi:hypothetical protein
LIIIDAAKFIQTAGLGVFDEVGDTGNIFLEQMPDGEGVASDAICLYSTGGGPTDGGGGLGKPGFQIIARGADLQELMTRASALRSLFDNTFSTIFCEDGTEVLMCKCQQSEPMHIGVDDNGRHEYSNTFLLITGG